MMCQIARIGWDHEGIASRSFRKKTINIFLVVAPSDDAATAVFWHSLCSEPEFF